jgi:uncharacterized repeat protein (TIGR01451 family)
MKINYKLPIISIAFFICFMPFFAQAQIVNIPDANFKAKLLRASTTFGIAKDSLGNNIKIDANDDGEIHEFEASKVYDLDVRNSNIGSLEGIMSFTNLKTLRCSDNQLSNLNVSGLTSLEYLKCSSNQLSSLDVSGLTSLESLECLYKQLSSLNVSGLTRLEELGCQVNQLTSLNVNGCTSLKSLNCTSNQLTSLDIRQCAKLESLGCGYNQLYSIDINEGMSLIDMSVNNNQLTTLDLSTCRKLLYLNVASNKLLKSIYLKNDGRVNSIILGYCPDLRFVCADENEISLIQQHLAFIGNANVIVNSFCSTTLDGAHYNLQCNAKYDADNNGCSPSEGTFPNLKIKIKNAIDSGYAISDAQGNFAMVLDSGTYTITPFLPNNHFICSPTSITVTFPEDTIPQQFCITPNGIRHDVAVSIIPTRPARPGFSDATYKIVLTNKGNQIENGVINFNYDEAKQDFISATHTPNNISSGQLVFNFSDLQLFETREIIIKFRTNSPTDSPPVNVGDVLVLYVEAILDNEIRDNWFKDNVQEIDQTVVGSIDPNDKTCLEGNIISPALVGDFVNYLIRFENTGTASAENVVVTDFIDINTFDIASLEMVSTSHSCKTLISEGNKVQFVFDNINLPFTEPGKHGYVTFKIKLKENLIVGDSLKNNADIFFDYNLPIKTNTAASNIANITGIIHVANKNGRLNTYPNPSNGIFTMEYIASGNYPITITLFDITGKAVYTNELQHQNKSTLPIEVNNLPSGMYHLQVNSPFGMANGKVVVE